MDGTQVQAAGVGGAAGGAVHHDDHLRAVRLHLGRQPAHRQGPRRRRRWPTPRTTSSSSDCSCCSSRDALAMVLPYEKPGPAARSGSPTTGTPRSAASLMAGCGLYALMGFPLDDMWHRIFGQDVTLWGPTHLMMIGGAGFSTLSALFLEHEGRKARTDDTPPDGIGLKFVQYLAFAGVLIGASVYPDRVRLRRAAVPAGVRADADRRRRRARLGGRPDLHGPGCRAHRRGRRHRSARDRRLAGGSRARRAGQLVRAVPRGRDHRRTAGPDPAAETAGRVRLGRRTRHRHRGTVAGVAVDQRRLLPPVADQHVAGGAGHGRTGRHPHRWLRSDGRAWC